MLPLHLPQVRVYHSSLSCKCTQSYNYMIHILEQSHVPFELIDPFKDKVDLSVLEKDGEDNIFFPQIFKFEHDLHKWVFVATLDSILEWNDAGTLHSRLTTPHCDDATPSPTVPTTPTTQTMLPEWSKRKGVSAYMTLISHSDSDARECLGGDHGGYHGGDSPLDIPTWNDATSGKPPMVEPDDARYSALLAKYASLETQSQQSTLLHNEQTDKLEALIKRQAATNQDLQAQLDEQKRRHVDSEKALFIEKSRVESESKALRSKTAEMARTLEQQDAEIKALRSKTAEMARTLEQQDAEIKAYDQIVESSQETILMHERTKTELTRQIRALEEHIAELVESAQRLTRDHAAQLTEHADRLTHAHAAEAERRTREHATLWTEHEDRTTRAHAVALTAQAERLAREHAVQRTEHEDRLTRAHAAELTAQAERLTREHATLMVSQAQQLRSQHASEVASSQAKLQALANQVVELQRTSEALQASLDERANAHTTPKTDEPREASNGGHATHEKPTHGSGNESLTRADDLDSKRQLLQLCRLQNDKERILITQLSSLFLPL